MIAYCALKGIDSAHQRERLTHFVCILDHAWMRAQHEAREKERGNSPTPPPSHSPPRDRGGKGSRRTQQVT